jgi:hypothetical protein
VATPQAQTENIKATKPLGTLNAGALRLGGVPGEVVEEVLPGVLADVVRQALSTVRT